MKELLIIMTIILGFVNPIFAFGQTAVNDTVFIKKNVHEQEIDTIIIKNGINPAQKQVLVGTTFLPYSDKMIGLMIDGISPISLEILQECDNNREFNENDYPKFINIERKESELTIDVSIFANCCHNFLGEAEIVGTDTLNLVYTPYGGYCSCNCCFTLRYKFSIHMEESNDILKYVTINGSEVSGQIGNK